MIHWPTLVWQIDLTVEWASCERLPVLQVWSIRLSALCVSRAYSYGWSGSGSLGVKVLSTEEKCDTDVRYTLPMSSRIKSVVSVDWGFCYADTQSPCANNYQAPIISWDLSLNHVLDVTLKRGNGKTASSWEITHANWIQVAFCFFELLMAFWKSTHIKMNENYPHQLISIFKLKSFYIFLKNCYKQFNGVSWPSGLAYRTQVLVLAAECGFESRPWHLCPWARHLIIIASLHPGVKWVPVRAELVD